MHIIMTLENKMDRVNIRIRVDVKDDWRVLAEYMGFGKRGLTTMVTHLVNEKLRDAKKNDADLFEDARQSVTKSKPTVKSTPFKGRKKSPATDGNGSKRQR